MVWARRFAGYKRADLLLEDQERFRRLMENEKYPIQIIWAGKPYPLDYPAISTFNRLVEESKKYKNMAVLTGYEIYLSKSLKRMSDVWLNNPRVYLVSFWNQRNDSSNEWIGKLFLQMMVGFLSLQSPAKIHL